MSSLLAADSISAPSVEYSLLLPILIVFGAAVVGVLVEAFTPRRQRYAVQMTLSIVSLLAAFVAVVWKSGARRVAVEGAISIDGPTLFIQGTILLLALVSVLTVGERSLDTGGDAFAASGSALPGSVQEQTLVRTGVTQTEVFPLVLFAVGGMLVFPAADDLLTMFVALEVLSLPLYLLCALARRKRLLSQEASLKYFLLGAFSSGFFIYGIAMIYGYAGTLNLGGISQATSASTKGDGLLILGTGLIAVGLLFKVSAAPFQAWTPDVYQGAPTPITGFMATCTKIAAFGALMRVFYVAFGDTSWDWRPMMWGAAILTMVVGSVVALTQTDIKRLLAYSSIAHAGFILVGVIALNPHGISSVLFYLVAYGFTTIGAFAVVTLVRDASGEANHLSQWVGLGKRSPLVAGVFAFFLLAFAGIPLTSGFTGKFVVFEAALEAHLGPLVVIGVIASAVAAFFYIRVIVLMFFSEPAADGPTVAVPSFLTTVAVTIGVAVTLVLGVAPQAVLDLANQAGVFVTVR